MLAMNRTNSMGLAFHLTEVPGKPGVTKISCGDKSITVNHNIHEISQAWYNWQMHGEKIQLAFMFLTNDEREFLMTAITPEEWKSIFTEEEN